MTKNLFFFFIAIFVLTIITFSCSGSEKKQFDGTVFAEVNGEPITVQDLMRNPMLKNIVKQLIQEKIIKQEFEARGLKLTDEILQEEWKNFIEMQQGNEEAALEMLKAQGMTKQSFLENMSYKVMLQMIIEQDKPITIEDARKEFEANPESVQRMYANTIPGKEDKPETVTFEDVADKMLKNLRQRQFSQEWHNVLETLTNEYKEKGWIKNYLEPEDTSRELTKIKKPEPEKQQIETQNLRPAPLKKREGKEDKEKRNVEESKGEGSKSQEETQKEEGTSE